MELQIIAAFRVQVDIGGGGVGVQAQQGVLGRVEQLEPHFALGQLGAEREIARNGLI